MFTEIGWPTKGKGTNESQQAFIERLPELMKDVRSELVAWSLLHDVEMDALGDLATTGLLTAEGTKKPGYEAFKKLARE